MFGQMMDRPLLISAILRHAELQHPNREIVSVTADQPRHRYTFREAFARSRKLANALQRLGLKSGDRVATLAWNDFRHFEIYYGVSGSGFVCHTINPRLFEDQIAYIVNHAEDRWLFLDPAFVPLIEKLQPRLPKLEGCVVLTDDAHMPATSLPQARSYESLIAAESDQFEWPEFDERTASSLCYTSGTTGDPKGVLYSHRSTVLHTLCLGAARRDGPRGRRRRHAGRADVPRQCLGAAVLAARWSARSWCSPGRRWAIRRRLQALIESEQVTFAAGVPTVWQGMIAYLEKTGKRIDSLKRVLSGGSAVPVALMNQLRERGVEVVHAWGMTEMSPIGTIRCHVAGGGAAAGSASATRCAPSKGRTVFGVELKITDEDGKELPRDGKSFGALKVRGPWIASSYYRARQRSGVRSGRLVQHRRRRHDLPARLHADHRPHQGRHQVRRRVDQLDRAGEPRGRASGGRAGRGDRDPALRNGRSGRCWSSVLKPGASATREELLEFYLGKVAKWWIPDDVVFVDKLPLTATGKLSKLQLRQQFADYKLPTD